MCLHTKIHASQPFIFCFHFFTNSLWIVFCSATFSLKINNTKTQYLEYCMLIQQPGKKVIHYFGFQSQWFLYLVTNDEIIKLNWYISAELRCLWTIVPIFLLKICNILVLLCTLKVSFLKQLKIYSSGDWKGEPMYSKPISS